MKKINSIGYGDKIIAAAAVLLTAMPLCLYIAGAMLPFPAAALIRISLAAGGLVILFLVALLTIEFRQDKKLIQYYALHQNIKLSLGNNRYECQSCGNRHLSAGDDICKVCGIRFHF